MNLNGLTKAWLSPKGEFINSHKDWFYDGNFHNSLAMYIIRDMENISCEYDGDIYEVMQFLEKHDCYAFEYLERLGWIRLYECTKSYFVIPCDWRINKQQESAILDWCIANNVKYNDAFNK